jgi:anti-sigma-K factor RskA
VSGHSHDDLMQLAPLHALGATTPDEAAAIELAMRSDPALAAEVAAHRATATALATSSTVAPSPALRGQLLAAIAREPARKAAPGATRSALSASRQVPRAPAWMTGALAASLILALGLGSYGLQLRSELAGLRASSEVLAERLEQREQMFNTVLEAERELYVLHLVSDAGPTGPGIQLFWNAKQGRAVAHVFRLDPAPAGKDYQIWALVNGKPVSVKVFNSDPDGHALVASFGVPGPAGVTALLVSLEPKGGSPLPTSTPFLSATFPGV